MVKLELYWSTNKDWWHLENNERIINNDAPKEAKESYKKYKKQIESIDRRTHRTLVIPKSQCGWEYYIENDAEWSRGSYSNKFMTVIDIPYKEFVILRNNHIIEKITYNGPRGSMNSNDIKECIKMVFSIKKQIPVFYAGLLEAEKYGLFADYVEENIL